MTSTRFSDVRSSLRFRITAWYLMTLSCICVGIGALTYVAVERDQVNDADGALAAAQRLVIQRLSADPLPHDNSGSRYAAKAAEIDHVGLDTVEGVPFLRLSKASSHETLFASKGLKHSVLASVLSEMPSPPDRRPQFSFVGTARESRMRVVSTLLPGQDMVVQLALLWDQRENRLEWTIVQISSVILSFLVLSGLGAWSAVTRALSPVMAIVAEAENLSASTISSHIFNHGGLSDQEIRRLVNALNSMVRRLHNSFERQREFTADAAHELKTPLTILRGEMQLALMKERPVEKYVAVLRSSLDEIERVTRIVSDLGALARLDAEAAAGLANDKPTAKGSVATVLNGLRGSAAARGITIEDLSQDECEVMMDEDSLTKVVRNLIDNAISYTESGGTVSVFTENANDGVRIIVRDTGVGISAEDLPRIFDRFYRADKSRHNSGGSGLGLSIVKAIVEAHDGTVDVSSTVGAGSEFTVCLPQHSA